MRARQRVDEYPAERSAVATLNTSALSSGHNGGILTETAAQNLIASLVAERDAAYQCGFNAGYLDGYSDGLHELLQDAELALGVAA